MCSPCSPCRSLNTCSSDTHIFVHLCSPPLLSMHAPRLWPRIDMRLHAALHACSLTTIEDWYTSPYCFPYILLSYGRWSICISMLLYDQRSIRISMPLSGCAPSLWSRIDMHLYETLRMCFSATIEDRYASPYVSPRALLGYSRGSIRVFMLYSACTFRLRSMIGMCLHTAFHACSPCCSPRTLLDYSWG